MVKEKPINGPDEDPAHEEGGLRPTGESGHSIANHSPVIRPVNKPAGTGQRNGTQKPANQGYQDNPTNSGSSSSEVPSGIPASWPAWPGPKLSPAGPEKPEKPSKDSAPAPAEPQPKPDTHHKKHHHHHRHHKH